MLPATFDRLRKGHLLIANPRFSVIGLCGFFLLLSFPGEAVELHDAVATLAQDIWLGASYAQNFDGRLAIAPFEAFDEQAGATCRGLLIARLQEGQPGLSLKLDLSDRPTRTLLLGTLTPATLKRLATALACDRLITGRLQRLGTFGVLALTLWDLHAGHVLDFAEVTFDLPLSWRELSPSPTEYIQKWRSRVFVGQRFLALAIADPDGDAQNEVLLATASDIYLLRWEGAELRRTDDLPRTYWPDARRQPRPLLRWRNLTVWPQEDRDRILVSVPPDWSASWDDLKFERVGMVVAAFGNTLWRTRFLSPQRSFSAQQTVQVTPEMVSPQPLPRNYRAFWVANVDDTPEPEYVLIDPQGSVCVYRKKGDQWVLWWQSPPRFGPFLAMGDLDGNGRMEIYGTGQAAEAPDTVFVLEWDGTVYGTKARWDVPAPVRGLAVGDVTQDDIDDLLVLVDHPLGNLLLLYGVGWSPQTQGVK